MKKGKDNTKKVIDVKDNFMEEDNDKRVIIFVAISKCDREISTFASPPP